jgi:glycolate oxidase FAD binding subunit
MKAVADHASQFVEQVLAARADGRSLYLCGGDSKRALAGRRCEAEDLDVGGNRGIVEYQPGELVLTARGGTTLAEIEQALAEKGQALSFEPPRFGGEATIAGTLACNLSGPARPWGGSIRDMVLGVRLINGRGEHLRFGGQVMKNVAGYDVSRFVAGSLGVLGIITEVSLKVLPRPGSTLTRVFEASAGDALETMNRRSAESGLLSGAAWVDGRMYLRLAGAPRAVAQAAADWGGQALDDADEFWTRLREQQLSFFAGEDPLWRFSLGANTGLDGFPQPLLIDWAGAQRWVRGDHALEMLETLARGGRGHVSLFRGGDRSGEVRSGPGEVERLLCLQLKRAFDPDGVFNPGRLYGWM